MLRKILENGKIIAIISSATLFVSSVLLVLYEVYALVETVINILSNFKDYSFAADNYQIYWHHGYSHGSYYAIHICHWYV